MIDIIAICISLLSFFAALAAIIIPIVIFKKQRKYEAEKEKQAKEEMAEMERKDAQAELDAMGVTAAPISLYGYNKMQIARARYLWKKAGRR